MPLTPRQMQILDAVVRHYRSTGRPVGSRTITALGVVQGSPSTVRAELHRLEQLGLLEHPHTSAGRVPTSRGYRHHVDRLMQRGMPAPGVLTVEQPVREQQPAFDTAIRTVTGELADLMQMVAAATSPATRGTGARHIELVQVDPRVVVAICITDAGDVSRHRAVLADPVDPALVESAAAYLREALVGADLGRHMLRQRLHEPSLAEPERELLQTIAPVFDPLVGDEDEIHVSGAAQLTPHLSQDVRALRGIISLIDERRTLLTTLRRMLSSDGVTIRIGEENDLPQLRSLSLVASGYGTHGRPAGIVALIGPRRMDYRRAVGAVRDAAAILGNILDDLPGTGDDK